MLGPNELKKVYIVGILIFISETNLKLQVVGKIQELVLSWYARMNERLLMNHQYLILVPRGGGVGSSSRPDPVRT